MTSASRRLAALALAMLLPLAACAKAGPSVELKGKRFTIEIAEDEPSREHGLMDRTKMDDDHGMLFIFEDDAPRAFWMKNTKIPLDMIFLDSNRRVVSVAHDAAPCIADPCPAYSSGAPARYVLELNAGQAARLGLTSGDELTVHR
ncbi:MAG: DUF192 domain-containing protein [Rhodanobacteraceae bacterium]